MKIGQDSIFLRSYEEKDRSFLFKSWLVSFKDSNHPEQFMDKKAYFDNHSKLIDTILENATCLIAANPEDETQIFGYIVYNRRLRDSHVLHYIYVKSPYRRLGIGSFLKNFAFRGDESVVTTHHTRMAHTLKDKWKLVFNPYLLLNLKEISTWQ